MFFKFPSTPYIEIDSKIVRKDKILSKQEVDSFLSEEIYVEEKIDGANLGISFNEDGEILFQNRGSYLYEPFEGQWKILREWLTKHEEAMFETLTDEYILFGEWCYATHSIFYDALPDWFVGFDIFDKEKKKFLSVDGRNHLMNEMEISIVPVLGKGVFSLNQLSDFLGQSKYGKCMSEGIYLRQDQGDYLAYRAKMVRKEFKQNIDTHWSKRKLQHNLTKDR